MNKTVGGSREKRSEEDSSLTFQDKLVESAGLSGGQGGLSLAFLFLHWN